MRCYTSPCLPYLTLLLLFTITGYFYYYIGIIQLASNCAQCQCSSHLSDLRLVALVVNTYLVEIDVHFALARVLHHLSVQVTTVYKHAHHSLSK